MSDENTPDVDDIKIRLSKEDIPEEDEIPVEDETSYKSEEQAPDVVGELRNLGRQFGETVRTAWNSEERREFESEMREGVQTFTQEVDKAFRTAMDSDAAKKAKVEAEEIRTRADSTEIADKTKSSLAVGLQWFSDELANLADQFTFPEKSPPAEEADGEESDE